MRARTSGFTLIELLVVIAVSAILLAVVVPSFNEMLARRKLEGAANELSADLQFARSQAVTINAAVVMTTSANGYTIGPSSTPFKSVALDPEVGLTSGITVTFDPLRATANAATLTLSSTQTSATLQLSTNLMGRVSLCSPGGSLKGYTPC